MKVAKSVSYTIEQLPLLLERFVFTTSSSEKSALWNLPPSDNRQHFLLRSIQQTNKGSQELFLSAVPSEVLAKQSIDDFYYDTKNFELFARGYACCLRHMLGRYALCLIPVTVHGELDGTRSSEYVNVPAEPGSSELNINSLKSGEIKKLLVSVTNTRKLHQQFRVRTVRQHLRVKGLPDEFTIILDKVRLKTSRGSTLVKSTTRYEELIVAPDSADENAIATIQNKLNGQATLFPLTINAFRLAIETDGKLLNRLRDRRLAALPSKRSGHDLFRAHMQTQFSELQRWVPIARQGVDTEGVHQMRITIRRMRAALNTFAPLLSKADSQYWHAELRWLAKRLGSVRDLDVFSDWLERYKPSVNQKAQEYIGKYQNDINDLNQHARQSLIDCLNSERYRSFIHEFSIWLEQERCFFVNNDLTWEPTQKLSDALIKRAVRRVNRKIKCIDHQCPAEELHKFRVECKRVRYSLDMLELFSSKRHKGLISRLKRIQEILGGHQDAFERSKRIRLYGNSQMSARHGQDFIFFLGILYSEQQAVLSKKVNAFFKQKDAAAQAIKMTLKS